MAAFEGDRILKVVKDPSSTWLTTHHGIFSEGYNQLKEGSKETLRASVTIHPLRTYFYLDTARLSHCSLNLPLDLVWGLVDQISLF